ncbi:O-linked beta-N-acetylglucosamine transferase [Synechococcus sp. A15-60]|nr:O-linked beta-N-acetylglucosamine transferase [Synechococcus sp. A15-60]
MAEAEHLYRTLLNLAPRADDAGDAAAGLGALLRGNGFNKEAGLHYRWALEHCRWSPILLSNACNWLREQGLASESLVWLQKGLEQWPQDLHLRWGLVLSLHHADQPEQALRQLEALIHEQGERPLLLQELVACLLSCGRSKEALSALESLRQHKPDDTTLLLQHLTLLQRLQRSQDAWALLGEQTILTEKELLRTKAVLLMADQRHQEALPLFDQLTELEPQEGDHWLNHAACQKALKQMVGPFQTLQAAVELHPERPDLLQALGSVLIEHGRWNEGLPLMQRSVSYANSSDVQQFNLQFAAAGNRLLPSNVLAARAREWESSRSLKPAPLWSDHIKDRSPDRRLRIGYLSQDLHNHPVGRFLEPLLRGHNRQQVEITGISCGSIHDPHSQTLKALCDRWLQLGPSTDLAAARQIAELEIDLLVELGGYTGGQRLRLLTARPAPIQLSYLGFFASTHLECLDGWIGDPVVFPNGLEQEAPGQTLHRLPRCYMAYQPDRTPDLVRTAPDQRFRFGCFNHSRKLSDPCLNLFAAVLQAVPQSLLVLKSQTFGEAAERQRIANRLEARGIPKERLELLERSDKAQHHLSLYGRMDAALDPIPYGGATTSAEALWMGVPVICLAGEGMVGRLTAAVLAGAGLDAAIAPDLQGYVSRAQRLASVGPRSAKQRVAIRQQLQRSTLMDGLGLAEAMEALYRKCWHQWLGGG